MKILTEEQKQKLLEEARKVRAYGINNDELCQGLGYLFQICWEVFDYQPIEMYLVKDISRKEHIRCCSGEQGTELIDNAIEKYNVDTPEDLVQIVDDMFYKLKQHDDR